jgi:hypothetical protein
MRIDSSALSCLLAIGSLSIVGGCPGTLADKELYEAALDGGKGSNGADAGPCGDVVQRIFVPNCGGTACHGTNAPQQNLDLVSPGVASRVVGVTGTGCSVPLADPKDPEGSLMYQKLLPNPPCGGQMPLARPPLGSADAACVLAWIAAQ